MKAIIIPAAVWQELGFKLIEKILVDAKKDWGCRFISRETGEELEDMAVRGQLIFSIDRVLSKIEDE